MLSSSVELRLALLGSGLEPCWLIASCLFVCLYVCLLVLPLSMSVFSSHSSFGLKACRIRVYGSLNVTDVIFTFSDDVYRFQSYCDRTTQSQLCACYRILFTGNNQVQLNPDHCTDHATLLWESHWFH